MDGVDVLREDIEKYIKEHRAVQEIKILEGRFADYQRRLKPLIAQEENKKAERDRRVLPITS